VTWTYSGDPATSDKDTVRFLVGDTDADAPEISDEEVLWLLTQEVSPSQAAARGADTLVAKYAKLVDRSIGAASISASQRYEHYRTTAGSLWGAASSTSTMPFAGGISVASKTEIASDTSLVEPAFTRDMMPYTSPLRDGRETI